MLDPSVRGRSWRSALVASALLACSTNPNPGAPAVQPPGPAPFPALLSSAPAADAGAVPRTAWLVFDFAGAVSEPQRASFALRCGDARVAIRARALEASRVVLDPEEDLPPSSRCTATWGEAGSLAFGVAAVGAPATVRHDRSDATLIAPFPDDALRVPDAATRTGFRVAVPVPARAPVTSVFTAITAGANLLDGFSPLGPIVVELDAPPNPASLPLDPKETLDPLATVFLVDVDLQGPSAGERVPFFLLVKSGKNDDGTEANVLVAFPARPLDPKRRYAFVVTRRALVDPTRPLDPSAYQQRLLRNDGGAAVKEPLEVLATRSRMPVLPEDVALLQRFTVRSVDDIPKDPLAIRAKLDAMAPPTFTVASATADSAAGSSVAAVVRGTWKAPMWRDGSHYFVRGTDGAPVQQGTVDVGFVLALPKREGGTRAPVVMYQHGTPGSAEREVVGMARDLAPAGFAVIGFTDVVNRDVIPNAKDIPTAAGTIVQAFLTAILFDRKIPDFDAASRADQLAFLRMIPTMGNVDVLPLDHPDGVPDLDVAAPLSYIGISQGSIHGTGLLPYAPEIRGAALVVGGGNYTGGVVHQNFEQVYGGLTATFPGTRRGELLVALALFQMQYDRQDALNHARYLRREPLGTRHASVLSFEGLHDTLVPPYSTQAAAWAMMLPHLEPVRRVAPALVAVTGPVKANLDADTTGGFLQMVPVGVDGVTATPDCAKAGEVEGHFCPQGSKDARAMELKLFASVAKGEVPTIEVPATVKE